MFPWLLYDIIQIIVFNFTNVHDIINFSLIDKATYELFDNNLYIYWGRNLYTKEFWDKARNRTLSISKPLINMKMELLRIDTFQKIQISKGYQPWTNEDFYNYWNGMEEYIKYKQNKELCNTGKLFYNDPNQNYTNEYLFNILSTL